MMTGLVPHQRMIDPDCRSDPVAAGRQVSSNDVLSGLRKMLELAQSGELELRVVGEAGFAVVVAQNSVRLTLVVEISDLSPGISPRELEIARLVARGATNQAIARALDISTWTVSTHLRRIFAKLSVGTRAEMVAELFGTPHLLSGDGRTNDRRRTNVEAPAPS
jgi:DNA-binding CsgD family transcriptional regulator